MTRDELDFAVELAAAEGWNPGIYDADAFHATDPNGFFIGLLGDEPISCISAVAYDDTFGFLGFYIVKPEHRGKGYGIQIWNEAVAYLNTQNIGLDGVVEQQDNYKKSGFKLAYSNIRYEGTAGGNKTKNPNIVPLSDVPTEKLYRYDHSLFPTRRSHFLKHWIQQPDSIALGMVKKGKLVGYGMVRPCRNGYKIGPLFADNEDIADTLFQELRASIPKKEKLYLDTPEVNPKAMALAEKYGMKKVFGTARMYTKDEPNIDIRKVFGVTTFELG